MEAPDADRERTLRLALWAAPIMVALVSLLDIWRGEVPIDFEFYYNAARGLAEATPPYQPDDFPILPYPPGSLYLLRPLGFLSVPVAGVVLGVIFWACAFVGPIAWAKRVGLEMPNSYAVAAGLMFFPVYRALEPLNMAVLLLALVALYAPPPKARRHLVDFAIGLVTGFVLSIKPHWLSIGGPMLAMQRRWAAIVGMFSGTAVLLAVSMSHTALWQEFLHRVTHEVGAKWTFDLWRISPWVGAAGFVIWCAVLAVIWWRKHPDAWIFALTAILIWPRPTGYGYIVLLPVMFYLWSCLDRAKWPLIAAFSTPFGLAMILDVTAEGVGMEIGYTWRTTFLSYMYYFLTLGVAIYLGRRFIRAVPAES